MLRNQYVNRKEKFIMKIENIYNFNIMKSSREDVNPGLHVFNSLFKQTIIANDLIYLFYFNFMSNKKNNKIR